MREAANVVGSDMRLLACVAHASMPKSGSNPPLGSHMHAATSAFNMNASIVVSCGMAAGRAGSFAGRIPL